MKNALRTILLAALMAALVGCVQTDISINLNTDGSGTVTETVTMSKAVTEQMRSTMESMREDMSEEEEGQDTGPVELWKEEDIRAQAKDMGEGVEFESMERIDTEEVEGYRAVFSFTDINKLAVNQNPGSSTPEQEGEDAEEGQAEQQPKQVENIMFTYDRGSPSTLTIRQPDEPKKKAAQEPEEEKAQKEEDPMEREMMLAMMQMILEGMKIKISVEVPGEVVSTNATYAEGSRITLMDMDFDKLLASEEHWKQFTEHKPDSVEGTKKLMSTIPGIKVEQEKEVTVKFQ